MIQQYGKKSWAFILLLLLTLSGLVEAAPADAANLTALTEGNNRFAFALQQRMQLTQPTGNVFYSPLSVSNALLMTYAGSRGETEAQMAAALQFGSSQEALHRDFSALLTALNSGKKRLPS